MIKINSKINHHQHVQLSLFLLYKILKNNYDTPILCKSLVCFIFLSLDRFDALVMSYCPNVTTTLMSQWPYVTTALMSPHPKCHHGPNVIKALKSPQP